jgi:hypothetical protein
MPSTYGTRPLSWYDCAPDYLWGEEDQEAADSEERERIKDAHIDEMMERRKENV